MSNNRALQVPQNQQMTLTYVNPQKNQMHRRSWRCHKLVSLSKCGDTEIEQYNSGRPMITNRGGGGSGPKLVLYHQTCTSLPQCTLCSFFILLHLIGQPKIIVFYDNQKSQICLSEGQPEKSSKKFASNLIGLTHAWL